MRNVWEANVRIVAILIIIQIRNDMSILPRMFKNVKLMLESMTVLILLTMFEVADRHIIFLNVASKRVLFFNL